MCGCRGGSKKQTSIQRVRIVPTRPQSVAPSQTQASVTQSVSFNSTPNTPDEQRKRLEKLRRDAIRKAFGR